MTGKDLKTKLELIGVPLRQVAEIIGISEQNLQNKLSAADIKVSFLCKLSLKLHRSVYFFLDGQDFYAGTEGKQSNENSSFPAVSVASSSTSLEDSSLILRLMDKLDEKDKEIRMLNEKLLATSMSLCEHRLEKKAAIAETSIVPTTAANMNLPISTTNVASVDAL